MALEWDAYADFYLKGPYASHVTEVRLGGSAPISMLHAAQPAGDFSDPPVSDLVLTEVRCDMICGSLDLGGGRFAARFRKGSFVVIPPGTATTILLEQPHSIRLYAIPEAHLRPLLAGMRGEAELFDFGRLHTEAFTSDRVRALSNDLWAAAADQRPTSQLAVDGALLSLLAEVYDIAQTEVSPARGGLAPWQLRWVTEHMQAHLSDDVSLAALAALVGLSPNHFCTAFKASTGEPPHRAFIRMRIERAKEMLSAGQTSITQIGLELGFGSSAHFSTVFRKHVGAAPTEFRRHMSKASPRQIAR
jgi:AraC family transcriptional regulator